MCIHGLDPTMVRFPSTELNYRFVPEQEHLPTEQPLKGEWGRVFSPPVPGHTEAHHTQSQYQLTLIMSLLSGEPLSPLSLGFRSRTQVGTVCEGALTLFAYAGVLPGSHHSQGGHGCKDRDSALKAQGPPHCAMPRGVMPS